MSGQNMIRNSSFESFSMQPVLNSQGKFYYYNPNYIQIVSDWDIINSPDYFNPAYTVGFYNVPYSRFGYSYAKHGNAFAGILMYYTHPTIEVKEYIYQHLSSPLIADSTYCLSFFVSLADYSPLVVKDIGAFFSVNTTNTGSLWYIQATPQVFNTSGFITDTANWVEIQGCFTAQGGEEYMTIGNFNSNANTDTASANPITPLTGNGNHVAYYYIDSISLYKSNLTTGIKTMSLDNDFAIYPNPSNGLIDIKNKTNSKAELVLIDIYGRIVNVYILDENSENVQLNLQNLESGIYYYNIKQNKILRKQDKFVLIK